MASIEELAREWLRLDRDEETRSVIEKLLAQQNCVDLKKLLSTRLTFGTAGLRAQMGKAFFGVFSSL